jgi:hypothetical protein
MKPIWEENLSDAIIWYCYSRLGMQVDRLSSDESSVETISWELEAYWCIDVELKSLKNSESLFLIFSSFCEILSNFSVRSASESSKEDAYCSSAALVDDWLVLVVSLTAR